MHKLNDLWRKVSQPYCDPTMKQKEAHGRFCHTMAGVSLAGAVTITFSENFTWLLLTRICVLLAWGILLFVTGSILSKGE